MIIIPVHYAYLSLSLATLLVWAALLWLNKGGRRRQIVLSSAFTVAGPIGELFYIPDYWHPQTILYVRILQSYISIEDFIFSFAIMGIMSSLPSLILRVPKTEIPRSVSLIAILKMAALLGVVGILSAALWLAGVNSIFATSLAMLLVAAFLLFKSRQPVLLRISIIGAVGMVLVMFIIYWLAFILISDSERILQATWSLYGTSLGIRVLRVPLSELVWAFCFGSFFSVLFVSDRVRGLP
jgi:hypothetical protein